MKTLTFTGFLRKEKKGYSAYCPEFEVASCGDTVEKAGQWCLNYKRVHHKVISPYLIHA